MSCFQAQKPASYTKDVIVQHKQTIHTLTLSYSESVPSAGCMAPGLAGHFWFTPPPMSVQSTRHPLADIASHDPSAWCVVARFHCTIHDNVASARRDVTWSLYTTCHRAVPLPKVQFCGFTARCTTMWCSAVPLQVVTSHGISAWQCGSAHLRSPSPRRSIDRSISEMCRRVALCRTWRRAVCLAARQRGITRSLCTMWQGQAARRHNVAQSLGTTFCHTISLYAAQRRGFTLRGSLCTTWHHMVPLHHVKSRGPLHDVASFGLSARCGVVHLCGTSPWRGIARSPGTQ